MLKNNMGALEVTKIEYASFSSLVYPSLHYHLPWD